MRRGHKSHRCPHQVHKEYTNGKDTNQSQEWIINLLSFHYREVRLDEEIIEEIARDIKIPCNTSQVR